MTQEEAREHVIRVIRMQKRWPRASYKMTTLAMLGALALGISAEGWRPLSILAGGLVGAFFGLLMVCGCQMSKKWVAIPMTLLAAFGFPAVLLMFFLGFPAGFEGLTCSIQFTTPTAGAYMAGVWIAARIGAKKLGIEPR